MRRSLICLIVLVAVVQVDAQRTRARRIRARPSPSVCEATINCVPTYFVDFSGGSDANAGTSSAAPWKHSPGDANATNNANITLAAGDVVVFKGGVQYNGQIDVNASGTSGSHITFLSGDRSIPTWGSGKGIVDGGTTRTFGFDLNGRSWIDIEGLEIRNIGAPTIDAAGVNFRSDAGAVDNNRVRHTLIHDVNYSAVYTYSQGGCTPASNITCRAYGIENNHGKNHTYEYNEIYNVTDKFIETYGGGTRGTNDANHNVMRYNVMHGATVHSMVLTSDDDAAYGNIIYQVNDGVVASGSNPGYCLKVDQGSRNQIYNNICYTTNSGFGVLVGDDNKFYHNTVYSIGSNGSGTHGSQDEVCISLFDDGSSSGWTAPRVVGNDFSNNLCDFLAGSGQGSDVFVYLKDDGGTGNLIKNNHFFKTSGDTTSTADRVRHLSGGSNAYGSVANLESNFDTWEAGSGNVASGNTVGDPSFSGGAYNAVGSLPTGFNSGTTTPNATGLTPTSTTVKTGGLTLGSPWNTDITGATRTNYSRGAYEVP